MTLKTRNEVLHLIEKATNYLYLLRWVDEKTTTGDFDGREVTIDVFFIPTANQADFLAQIRPIRGRWLVTAVSLYFIHQEPPLPTILTFFP